MTAEIRLAALCDHALVGQDGKVSLMGIFRNISVSGLPAQHPRMFVVAILGLEVGAHTVKVRLLRPDGQQAMPNPPEISGGLGIACCPSGRSRRTLTVCAPTSSPRIATTNIRGCCAGSPLTEIFRKIPIRLTFPSCPTRAWSQSAASLISAVTRAAA